VLLGRGLCVGLITRPEESYRVLCVQWVWSRSPVSGGHDPASRRRATGKTASVLLCSVAREDQELYFLAWGIKQQKVWRSG